MDRSSWLLALGFEPMALGTFMSVKLQLALNIGVAIVLLGRLLWNALGVRINCDKVVLLLLRSLCYVYH